MGADTILSAAATIALFLMGVAFFLTAFRIVRGPTLPDRIVALDMLVAIAIGFIAVIALKTGFSLYIDIAIALGLVGFLATVAFARFVLRHGLQPEDAQAENAAHGNNKRRGPRARAARQTGRRR